MAHIASLYLLLALFGCSPHPALQPVVISGPIVDTGAAPAKRPAPKAIDHQRQEVRDRVNAIQQQLQDLKQQLTPARADER